MDGTVLDDHIVDYASAISSQAIRRADLVVALLQELGITPEDGGPIALPREFLRGLGFRICVGRQLVRCPRVRWAYGGDTGLGVAVDAVSKKRHEPPRG